MISTQTQSRDTSVKTLIPKPKRERVTFRFQLDIARDNVEFFMQLQQWLAAKRSWKRYAMDGLRLIYDLKNGSTEVLLELFPNIREMLGQGGDDSIKNELAELKRLLLEREIPPTGGYTMTASQPPTSGQQPLAVPKQIALPVFADDDDEDTVILATASQSAGSEAAANFLAAMSTQVH